MMKSLIYAGVLAAALVGNVAPASAEDISPELRLTASQLQLSLPADWHLGEVAGLEVDARGHVYVFNRGLHSLLEFRANGRFVREIGKGLFRTPHGLRVDEDGNIWTTDQETHQVLRFDREGKVTLILGRRDGPGTGWYERGYTVALLNAPSDVAFDSQGNIYVADGGNFRVVKYDRHGEPLMHWGTQGTGPGEFDFPHSIAVDEDDQVYVTDRENGRVQIFTANGDYIDEWSGFGNPYEIQRRPDGTFWLTDARAGTLFHLDAQGKILGRFGKWGKEIGDFGFPHGFDFTANGDILVGEILNWRIQKLTVPKLSR